MFSRTRSCLGRCDPDSDESVTKMMLFLCSVPKPTHHTLFLPSALRRISLWHCLSVWNPGMLRFCFVSSKHHSLLGLFPRVLLKKFEYSSCPLCLLSIKLTNNKRSISVFIGSLCSVLLPAPFGLLRNDGGWWLMRMTLGYLT